MPQLLGIIQTIISFVNTKNLPKVMDMEADRMANLRLLEKDFSNRKSSSNPRKKSKNR